MSTHAQPGAALPAGVMKLETRTNIVKRLKGSIIMSMTCLRRGSEILGFSLFRANCRLQGDEDEGGSTEMVGWVVV